MIKLRSITTVVILVGTLGLAKEADKDTSELISENDCIVLAESQMSGKALSQKLLPVKLDGKGNLLELEAFRDEAEKLAQKITKEINKACQRDGAKVYVYHRKGEAFSRLEIHPPVIAPTDFTQIFDKEIVDHVMENYLGEIETHREECSSDEYLLADENENGLIDEAEKLSYQEGMELCNEDVASDFDYYAGVAKTDLNITDLEAELASLTAEEERALAAIAESERGIAESERGIAESERGIAESERGIAESERGIAAAKAGQAGAERSIAESERGIAEAEEAADKATTEFMRELLKK